jgi:hypothetical protein
MYLSPSRDSWSAYRRLYFHAWHDERFAYALLMVAL